MLAAVTGAAVLSLAGVAAIFSAWRRLPPPWRTPVTAAGWLLLIGAGWCWVHAAGAEFGITLALLVPALFAWVLVFSNREHRQRRSDPRTRDERAPEQPIARERPWSRHLVLFVLAVPGAAVASTLLTVAASLLLPWREVNVMVLVLAVLPLVWGAAAYWVSADARVERPALAMLVAGVASALVIYG